MKKLTIILFLLGATTELNAQTFNELFRQNKTQKKYLTQQIAALQVYIGYAQKGYSIARDGLDAIGNFKRGEFGLHTGYFRSLKNVNPKIRNVAQVAGIIALQVEIVNRSAKTFRWLQQSNAFTVDEQAYIKRVFGRLLEDCETVLDELLTVTTDSELEMKDDERLERIDVLYRDMMDKSIFSQSFSNETRALAASRSKENRDVQIGRLLHDIKED